MVTDECKPPSRTGIGKVCIEASPSVTQASDLRKQVTPPLADALGALAETGRTTPCQREPDLWTSDDSQERQEAAYACQMCPILTACANHAETLPESWWVWGGTDRSRKKK